MVLFFPQLSKKSKKFFTKINILDSNFYQKPSSRFIIEALIVLLPQMFSQTKKHISLKNHYTFDHH